MAKTIEEIYKELTEWQKENPRERSIVAIAGYEDMNIMVKSMGDTNEIVTCVASAMENSSEVEEQITKAQDILKKYRKDEQKTENN